MFVLLLECLWKAEDLYTGTAPRGNYETIRRLGEPKNYKIKTYTLGC